MKTLIAANWKMHGDMSWADKPTEFAALTSDVTDVNYEVLFCAPDILLSPLYQTAAQHGYSTGGQDCHWEHSGAHTGETSAALLKSAGATHVIIGHSERRAAGETDTQVKAKLTSALEAGLIPILCVGETRAEREGGQALSIVEAQLKAALPAAIPQTPIVIAYEPVWAIGTGLTPSLEDIRDMHDHIRGLVGTNTPILYGGSVKPANAGDILALYNVNGALIGGASLDMESLAAIAKSAL